MRVSSRYSITSWHAPGIQGTTLDRCAPGTVLRHSARPVLGRVKLMTTVVAQQVPVTFKVKKEVKAGEHLRVVGSPTALGSWEVSKAPRLSQDAGAQQMWSGTVELPLAQSFEFKFAVVPDAAGTEPTWEGTGNRTFQPGGAQTLTAVFDQPGFEAGAAAAVAGSSQPTGSRRQEPERGHGIDWEVRSRLQATLRRLAAEAMGSG